MEKYFNKKLYTDVQSWKVIELDEVKGGFAAHCVNNYEAF